MWLPLAATWLMMAVEGPFLAAVIARLDDPRVNLAAYGVAFSFALIVEAPIIMILSASTALVRDRDSYRKLRNFTFTLNFVITLVMLVVLWRPVFDWIAVDLVSLPLPVAELTRGALVLLLPWPAAIGFRRFYQGLLIRRELTRRVALGTVIRVVGMGTTALLLYRYSIVPGALVGGAALAAGVVLESIGTRLMAVGIMEGFPVGSGDTLTYRRIVDFYFPLALTSIIALGVHPMVTFFVGGSRRALDSLAVLPVLFALTFIFRSVALSYQEVAIALLDGSRENFRKISTFAGALALVATFGLVLTAFTPLSWIWFHQVSGLSEELSTFAIFPLRLFCVIPFFAVLLAFQRAILVFGRKTRPVTVATVLEVSGIVAVLFVTIRALDFLGVVAAVVALLLGRMCANAYLMYAAHRVLASTGVLGSESQALAIKLRA
ncbi:MAG TPA: hypothetical protein VEK15_05885 [Vicinamibacteria bacterium]|nr:hypothetical protein [Vicinamibacteria bacterium]